MKRLLPIALALVAAACSSAPAPEKTQAAPPPPPVVKDDRALLPEQDRTGTEIVGDHLLGKKELPGGTLGEYEVNGKKYRMFIIETSSPQDAAILLLDLKNTLSEPEYIAYMGGYFGPDSGQPVYAFAKLKYLAGIVGLDKDKADPLARQLAARLH
jgi:hypothetical protein